MDTKQADTRFWAQVAKGAKCWKWQGTVHKTGYGVFYDAGRLEYAHRFAYLLLSGDIRKGEKLYNTCLNRLCVNPEHWTTAKPIHITDSITKRQKPTKRRYSRRREKVTPAQVAAIIDAGENTSLTQTAIASRYRLSQAQVSRILSGRSR